jgi:hypothetical protein
MCARNSDGGKSDSQLGLTEALFGELSDGRAAQINFSATPFLFLSRPYSHFLVPFSPYLFNAPLKILGVNLIYALIDCCVGSIPCHHGFHHTGPREVA